MPLIQREADRYQSQGLAVLGVNYQQTDTNAMKSFLKKADARFPAVYDPIGQIAGAFGVTIGLPVSVFIDRSGDVSFIQLGQLSSSVLEQHLDSIL